LEFSKVADVHLVMEEAITTWLGFDQIKWSFKQFSGG